MGRLYNLQAEERAHRTSRWAAFPPVGWCPGEWADDEGGGTPAVAGLCGGLSPLVKL